ncbi:MAG: hypothetical protein ABR552_04045, partial [Actinomycetota bacterium]
MGLRSGSARPTRRVTTLVVVSAFAATLIAAAAAPASAQVSDAYSGFASGSIVHVDAITTGSLRVADFEVGVGNAQVNSEGLQTLQNAYGRRIAPHIAAGSSAGAYSSILEAGVLLNGVDADNQVAPFTAESYDGVGNVDSAVIPGDGAGNIAPLVWADVLRKKAVTNWNAANCVIGDPIAAGEQYIARADVLDPAATAANSTNGFDKPLLSLDRFSAGPRQGVSDVISRELIYVGNGGNLGLYSVTATTLAPVTLFAGTPNELTIEADGPAYLVARADGSAGGAKVDYIAPTLTVIQAGVKTTILPDAVTKPTIIYIPGTQTPLVRINLG